MSANDTISQPHSSVPDALGKRQTSPRVRLVGYAVGILLTIGLTALGFWVTTVVRGTPAVASTKAPDAAPTAIAPLALQRPVVTEDGLVEKSGVRIVYVAVSGGGGLIDLRYQVVDPNKANAVHDDKNPPTIIDGLTGLVVNNLLMGHSHTGTFNAGQTYYLIFENPGNIVQSGNKVSILLGNAEVDNVIVQ